jgi:hypothetical protein
MEEYLKTQKLGLSRIENNIICPTYLGLADWWLTSYNIIPPSYLDLADPEK